VQVISKNVSYSCSGFAGRGDGVWVRRGDGNATADERDLFEGSAVFFDGGGGGGAVFVLGGGGASGGSV
jgi:hypothetical protein